MNQQKLFEAGNDGSWFQDALTSMDMEEKDCWPDKFGERFHNWVISNKVNKIKTLSLFSGGGGLDIAFHDMGFDIVECVEIEKDFVATLTKNSAEHGRLYGTKVVCKDIREYIPSHEDLQFIIGGPPCQTFSAAGARASGVNGIDDSRGTLFEEYVRILKQTKPKGFLFENVYRIVGAQGGEPWRLIQDAFRGAGYKLFWRILDAADYGVPQHRERLIIVGIRDEGHFYFPKPSHGPDSSDHRPYYTAGQAVNGLDTSKCEKGINGRHGHLLDEIPPGLNYSYYTDRMGHPKPIFGWRSKFSDYLYKADPYTPVRTIKAQGGQYTGPFSWENRQFTVEEIKRLQTFPDNYVLMGGRQIAVHQLGNSVPPQIGRVLAASILNQVFGIKLPFSIEYLSDDQKLGFRKRKSALTEIYKNKANLQISKNKTLENDETKKHNGEIIGSSICYLSTDFKLSEEAKLKSDTYRFDFDFTNIEWKIILSDKNTKLSAYVITIELTPEQQNSIGTKKITLQSNSCNPKSLLALWKFLERSIMSYAHKDDLIQLFGYYKYRTTTNLYMSIHDESLKTNDFWRVASLVTKGVSVGTTIHIDQLIACYGLGKERLRQVLFEMKTIGFEIRNKSTNKQIKEDHYLVPYPFPTLNERSLQRLTEL